MGTSFYNSCSCQKELITKKEEFLTNFSKLDHALLPSRDTMKVQKYSTPEIYFDPLSSNRSKQDLAMTINSSLIAQNDIITKSDTLTGVFVYDSKLQYTGDFIFPNIKSGKGILKDLNSGLVIYDGEWANNDFDGFGVLNYSQDEVYQGQFRNGKKHGKGIFFNRKTNYRFEGEWENDEKQGYGNEILPDNTVYQGYFVNNLKQGKGQFSFANGNTYEGDFLNNMIHGKGIFNWSEKKTYEGEWKSNSVNGFGILRQYDKTYIGFFENDKKNGFGATFYKNKNFLIGKYINNQLDGLSVYFTNNKFVYILNENGNKKIIENEDEIKLIQSQEHDYKSLMDFYDDLLKNNMIEL